jgi:hypothetical protein
MSDDRPKNTHPPIIDERARMVIVAERMILQCKRRTEITAHLIDTFKIKLKVADAVYDEAEEQLAKNVKADKDRIRAIQLAKIDRVMALLLEKENYKTWVDVLREQIRLTVTEAPQEVNISAPFFQQYLEHRAKMQLGDRPKELELEPCQILEVALKKPDDGR